MSATSWAAGAAGAVTPPGTGGARTGHDAVTLGLRRVYILPTRQGLTYALMLFVMWLGAVNYDNGLAHVLVFTLGALGLVSMLHTCRNLSGLRVQSAPSRPVFAGDVAQLALQIDEPGARARHDIVVRHADPAASAIAEMHLDAGESARAELSLPATHRGWLRREQLVVASRYPFGLLRAWSTPRIELACLVYPAPAAQVPPLHDRADSEHDGDFGAAGEEDFAGLRAYVEGDSLQRVHWKAAARKDDLEVKRFEGAAPAEVQLDYAELTGTTEQRLSQLCAMVLEAHAGAMRYALRLPGTFIAAGGGDAHRHECLAALAEFDREPGAAR